MCGYRRGRFWAVGLVLAAGLAGCAGTNQGLSEKSTLTGQPTLASRWATPRGKDAATPAAPGEAKQAEQVAGAKPKAADSANAPSRFSPQIPENLARYFPRFLRPNVDGRTPAGSPLVNTSGPVRDLWAESTRAAMQERIARGRPRSGDRKLDAAPGEADSVLPVALQIDPGPDNLRGRPRVTAAPGITNVPDDRPETPAASVVPVRTDAPSAPEWAIPRGTPSAEPAREPGVVPAAASTGGDAPTLRVERISALSDAPTVLAQATATRPGAVATPVPSPGEPAQTVEPPAIRMSHLEPGADPVKPADMPAPEAPAQDLPATPAQEPPATRAPAPAPEQTKPKAPAPNTAPAAAPAPEPAPAAAPEPATNPAPAPEPVKTLATPAAPATQTPIAPTASPQVWGLPSVPSKSIPPAVAPSAQSKAPAPTKSPVAVAPTPQKVLPRPAVAPKAPRKSLPAVAPSAQAPAPTPVSKPAPAKASPQAASPLGAALPPGHAYPISYYPGVNTASVAPPGPPFATGQAPVPPSYWSVPAPAAPAPTPSPQSPAPAASKGHKCGVWSRIVEKFKGCGHETKVDVPRCQCLCHGKGPKPPAAPSAQSPTPAPAPTLFGRAGVYASPQAAVKTWSKSLFAAFSPAPADPDATASVLAEPRDFAERRHALERVAAQRLDDATER